VTLVLIPGPPEHDARLRELGSTCSNTHQWMRTLPPRNLAAWMKSLQSGKYCVRFWSGVSDAITHR